ncbi:hypothetical protein CPC08DRAFT_611761, partial [Agrocybe pediades]
AERLQRDWTSTTYAFFDPTPDIVYIDGRRVHVFKCNAGRCKGKGANPRLVNHYLGTKDASSTSNLRKHVKVCFGDNAVEAADACRSLQAARDVVKKAGTKNQPLTALLECAGGKEKVTYSHMQHTTAEQRIVKDRGFQSLMKTGPPGIHIPSPATVSRNVKMVFINSWQRISKMLRVSCTYTNTNAWTSLNHKAYMAVTVHFENDGVPISMLLDIVKVAK